VPFLLQAVRQGLQDLGARDLPAARAALATGAQRVEARSSSAQVPPARCLIRLHELQFRHARAVRVAACCTLVQAPRGGRLVGCRAVRLDASLAVVLSGDVRDVHAELRVAAAVLLPCGEGLPCWTELAVSTQVAEALHAVVCVLVGAQALLPLPEWNRHCC
jgi:hypothetical protein